VKEKKQEFTLDCKVDSYRAGWTVVEFLSHRFRYHPAERWAHRVEDGRVQVNGSNVVVDHIVHERDVVTYSFLHNEPPVDMNYDVVYEDDDMLVVSKSGNLPVHACGVYIKSTLITHIKNTRGEHINLAHRLDRETSGLVVMSKNVAAARELGRMFAKGEVEKTYLAAVHGLVADNEFVVDAPIGKADDLVPMTGARETMRGIDSDLNEDLPRFVPRRVVDFERGKPAVTSFRVLRRNDGDAIAGCGGLTLLEARPHSGRTNQIRVHLHHAGYPIVGDKVYGPKVDAVASSLPGGAAVDSVDADPAGPLADRGATRPGVIDANLAGLTRHALHCRSLSFLHPTTGEPLVLTAPVPVDLRSFVSDE
jgi:23S rRNA-/tRNA-specific pseudouridylate synthase